MSDLTDTAVESIQSQRNEIQLGLFADEQSAIRGQPKGGNTIHVLLGNYNEAAKRLADHCVNQYRWINQHSLLPGWMGVSRFDAEVVSEMTRLNEFCEGRLRNVCQMVGLSNPAMIDGQVVILRGYHGIALRNLALDLRAARAEGRRATVRKGVSPMKWLAVAISSAVIGALIHKYLEK